MPLLWYAHPDRSIGLSTGSSGGMDVGWRRVMSSQLPAAGMGDRSERNTKLTCAILPWLSE
jgi:hypothetical protein